MINKLYFFDKLNHNDYIYYQILTVPPSEPEAI